METAGYTKIDIPALVAENIRLRGELATARNAALEEAAQWHDEQRKGEDAIMQHYKPDESLHILHAQLSLEHRISAQAIRALKRQEK